MAAIECGTSYFGVRDSRHVADDLDRFRSEGLNAVLHTFSERDQAYYQETMEDIVAASHDRGFRVYVNPWAVGRVFGGEALSEFIGTHPEARQVLSDGTPVPAACFNNPTFREFMREWTRDAAALGADVLFWDEPHWFIHDWVDAAFPDDTWSCRCEHCQASYEDAYGEPMPANETERVAAFREQSLLAFLETMMAEASEHGAENAVCLLPSEDADHGLRDWDDLAAQDDLDVLATDPYWHAFDTGVDAEQFVGEWTDTVVSLAEAHGLRSQIWIQGFRLDGSEETIETVRAATGRAIDGGVDSVFMWGYDGCRSISSIACQRPEDVWDAFLEGIVEGRDLRGR
ncbi:MAG: hypothetical protein ABEI98_03090 [Halorhabdus sp.]